MLLSVMGSKTRGQVKAYEKLFGVGLGVVEFTDTGYSEEEEELVKYYQQHGYLSLMIIRS